MGTNVHLVAIAARNIHIATIDPANDFKIQHMNVIPPHESLLLNHEKCWVSLYSNSVCLFQNKIFNVAYFKFTNGKIIGKTILINFKLWLSVYVGICLRCVYFRPTGKKFSLGPVVIATTSGSPNPSNPDYHSLTDSHEIFLHSYHG